jgi:hypothetical protein
LNKYEEKQQQQQTKQQIAGQMNEHKTSPNRALPG